MLLWKPGKITTMNLYPSAMNHNIPRQAHTRRLCISNMVCSISMLLEFQDTDISRACTCIGAIFVDQSPGSPISDVERWITISEESSSLAIGCVLLRNMGGTVARLGLESRGLNFYFYAPDSPFDLMLQLVLRCPTCNQNSCSARLGTNAQCSNNKQVTENPSAPPGSPNPQIPSTLPRLQNDFRSSFQQGCSISCHSQADCECSGYQCMQDNSVIARLRKTTMECVFVPLASSLIGKRDMEP